MLLVGGQWCISSTESEIRLHRAKTQIDVLGTVMSCSVMSGMQQKFSAIASGRSSIDLDEIQRSIYQFLLDLVATHPPTEVLREFQYLFFDYYVHPGNAEVMNNLSDLIAANDREKFLQALKRCCYILINNWETQRNSECISQLVLRFSEVPNLTDRSSKLIKRLRKWLKAFIESQDYQDLKIFANKHNRLSDEDSLEHWSHRYTSYLLVSQFVDTNNPKEQREAAQFLSQKLKNRFKFDLAMYAARSQLGIIPDSTIKNPTFLGEDVLRLIKKILIKKSIFDYQDFANLFLRQINGLKYKNFKKALHSYLFFSYKPVENDCKLINRLNLTIDSLYQDRQEETIDDALLLRTCNRVIDYLTASSEAAPSELFIFLMLQGNPLTLAIILLKLILICPNARTHLEQRVAQLIKYYQNCPQESCLWAIHFFEILRIVLAIYGDRHVQYNIIKIKRDRDQNCSNSSPSEVYGIFSQYRQ